MHKGSSYQAVHCYVKPLQCQIDRLKCQVDALMNQCVPATLARELEVQKAELEKMSSELGQDLTTTREELRLTMAAVEGYTWYTGEGNNRARPDWGKVGTQLLRKAPSAFTDTGARSVALARGLDGLARRGEKNPGPRVISNRICAKSPEDQDGVNTHRLSDFLWIWGQFLDHELDLTETGTTEPVLIETSPDDPYEQFADPVRKIDFHRSQFVEGTGTDTVPREHPNQICSFINGGVIYGVNRERVFTLRLMDGTGKMRMIYGGPSGSESLLPKNTYGLPNAQDSPHRPADQFFLSGDIRANENVFLTSMHTLFMRNHNRLCEQILTENSQLEGHDELIFQKARRLNVAAIQKISYEEFLPALLGPDALPEYTGYQQDVNTTIATEFSTVGYRVGHTMLSSRLNVDAEGGTLLLRECFFNPAYVEAQGIDNLLFGGCLGLSQKIDAKVVDDIRNFLFGPPTASHLLDLATLNIMRGRDHGIADYNTLREAYGLPRITEWSQLTSDTDIATGLADLYDSVDTVDPWVGAICEDHMEGRPVGPLIYAILVEQFTRIRDGDRFWYQNTTWDSWEREYLDGVTLSQVVKDNTKWGSEFPSDPFHRGT